MSPLVVLGALGTLFSTITILPHLARAIRTKQPSGSPVAWAMGATGSVVWLVYGVASGDPLVGAPGVVTIPAGVLLTVWSLRWTPGAPAQAVASSHPAPARASAALPTPRTTLSEDASPPTLEMPAVA